MQLWSAANGQEILTLRGRPISVGAAGLTARVAFSPDGTRIAANALGGWVNIWDSRPIAESGSRRPLSPGERIDSP